MDGFWLALTSTPGFSESLCTPSSSVVPASGAGLVGDVYPPSSSVVVLASGAGLVGGVYPPSFVVVGSIVVATKSKED